MNTRNYNVNLNIPHNKRVYLEDIETNELTPITISKKPSNGMKKFDLMNTYHRRNTKAWNLLETQTTTKEYQVADKLAKLAKAFTSSLEPLNPDSTISEIAQILNENRRTISKVIDKLFKLGVIGKFEVYDSNQQHTRYWIFNPYLSFNGNVIKENVPTLFDNTYYAKV